MVQEVLTKYYAMPEPLDSLAAFLEWSRKQLLTELRNGARVRDGIISYDRPSPGFKDSASAPIKGRQEASQINDCLARQIISVIDRLPISKQRVAWSMIDGADLAEASRELSLTMYEAMFERKSVTELVRRLIEDEADGKKFEAEK
jgi:hypothetical protein